MTLGTQHLHHWNVRTNFKCVRIGALAHILCDARMKFMDFFEVARRQQIHKWLKAVSHQDTQQYEIFLMWRLVPLQKDKNFTTGHIFQ